MILFTILLLMLILLTVITVLVVSAGGAVFIVIFGDVIVCIFLIIWLMKRLITKKKEWGQVRPFLFLRKIYNVYYERRLIYMFKKLLGGVLLCGILVPVSTISYAVDGISLILNCMGNGMRLMFRPLAYRVVELLKDVKDNNSFNNKTVVCTSSSNETIES